MFQHALLPTDLTSSAQTLTNCLKEFKRLGVRKITLVHVVNISSPDGNQAAIGDREDQLEEQSAIVARQGFEIGTDIRVGLPPVEIIRSAKEHGVSFILLNARKHNPLCDLPLGDVAAETLQQTSIPILLINFKMTEESTINQCSEACNKLLGHVLWASDFSPSSQRALSFLEKLIEAGNRKVSLLHVQDREKIDPYLKDRLDEFNRIDRDRLEKEKMRLERKGATEVLIDVPYGFPKEEIKLRCKQNGVSLIVIGKRGRGCLEDASIGSVSHFIIRKAERPILIIPEEKQDI